MQGAEAQKRKRGQRRTFIGTVVSDKMDKTVVVEVKTMTKHKLFDKIVKVRKTYKAHDEKNECKVGDKVRIMETRPLSKEKRYRVEKIIERAK